MYIVVVLVIVAPLTYLIRLHKGVNSQVKLRRLCKSHVAIEKRVCAVTSQRG